MSDRLATARVQEALGSITTEEVVAAIQEHLGQILIWILLFILMIVVMEIVRQRFSRPQEEVCTNDEVALRSVELGESPLCGARDTTLQP